jgi:hypothetical protein
MTAHRRPLLLSVAGAALLLPACLSFPVHPAPITPPEARDKLAAEAAARAKESPRKTDFAALLSSRPGDTVAKNAGKNGKDGKDAKDTTAQKQPVVGDPKAAATPAGGKVPGDPTGPQPLPPLQTVTEHPLLAIVRAQLEDRPARALELLQALPPANQEVVLAVLPALTRGATADLASDPTATALLADQLRFAAARLAARSALVVENVALCRKVYGFGRYEPWPEGQPYKPNDLAQLYLEVRNLVSQPAAGPRGETHLTYVRAAVEIRDAHGRLVDQPDPEDWRRRVPIVRFEKKQFSRGAVDDFHVLYAFPVPPAPGVYTVTVELRDPAGRRSVKTAPVRFDVAGP